MRLERLELIVDGAVERADALVADAASAIAQRFPAIELSCRTGGETTEGAVCAAAWRADDLDVWAFDRALDRTVACREPLRVHLGHEETPASCAGLVIEVLTRAQRLCPRTNAASEAAWFRRVLVEHRALHDVSRPLVQADLDHALDTWQWSLCLDPRAPAAVQLACLCHDLERLISEADRRIEQHAADYQAFKDAHAQAGAHLASELFARAGVPEPVARAAIALVARHERTGDDPAIRALNDADALSFFAFNSPGYLAYFGPDQTRAKVAYTLARMSPAARAQLAALRMPRLVCRELEHLLTARSA